VKGWTDCPNVLAAFFAPYSVVFLDEMASSSVSDRFRALGGQGEPAAFTVSPTSEGEARQNVTLMVVAESNQSQFDVMRKWMPGWNVEEGIVCAQAMKGANFHGQHGRPWIAHQGNLHLSILIPCDLDARHAPAVNALPTIAVCRALEKSTKRVCPQTAPPMARIKWVNDVLVGGAKISGSIAAGEVVRGRLTALVLGTGLNVLVRPDVVRSPSVPAVTCLADVIGGFDVLTPGQVMIDWVDAVLFWMSQPHPSAWVDVYRSLTDIVGRIIRVWQGGDEKNPLAVAEGILEGRVAGISDDLELILEGTDRAVRRGQIEFLN